MPLADVQLSKPAPILKSSTPTPVNVLVLELSNAVVDSSGTQFHVHALLTQLPDVCPTCTSSTLKHATVNASTFLNAFATLSSTMPPVLVQLCQLATLHRSSTTVNANADAQQLRLADVDSNGMSIHAHVSPTQLPDVCPTCTPSTCNNATVSAKLKLNACAELRQSTPPALALHTRHAQLHKPSTLLHVNADVLRPPLADVDSFGTPTHAHASRIQTPDACPTSTDSIETCVHVFVSNKPTVCVELNQ